MRVDDDYWVDKYDANGVLDGASSFEAGYVRSGEFSYARYQFNGATKVMELATLVTNKYGQPSRKVGSEEKVGSVTYVWDMPDGTYIEVSRPWGDTMTYLSFANYHTYKVMNAEIEEQKRANEEEKAKAQSKSNAF